MPLNHDKKTRSDDDHRQTQGGCTERREPCYLSEEIEGERKTTTVLRKVTEGENFIIWFLICFTKITPSQASATCEP